MEMLTHALIWAAIDAMAERHDMSASGLARSAGLDATTFNPSKRFTAQGRERWPSTESIAKIMKSTNTSIDQFMQLVTETQVEAPIGPQYSDVSFDYTQIVPPPGVPLIGSAQAGEGGFFDDGGFPVGHGWDEVQLPQAENGSSYALKVSGDSMMPLYRDGDILIVDPTAKVRAFDRVVAKTQDGEVFAKILKRRSSSVVEFQSANPEHPDLSFAPSNIEWISRIVWASQ